MSSALSKGCKASTSVQGAENIWQIALALVLIVGLVVALGYVAKRLKLTPVRGGGRLSVLESAYLGPKERLVLVECDGRQVLLGVNPQCITKLMEHEASHGFADALDHAIDVAERPELKEEQR